MSGRGGGGRGGPKGGGAGGGGAAAAAPAQGGGAAAGGGGQHKGGGGGGGGGKGGGGGGKSGGGGGGGGGGAKAAAAAAEELKRKEAEREAAAAAAAAAAQAAAAAAAAAKRAEAEKLKAEAEAASVLALTRAAHAAARSRFDEEQSLWSVRLKLRESNLPVTKAPAGQSTGWQPSAKMDSSIKKCSGYIKKLKLLNEHPQESLLKELDGVTLTKYVDEVATTLLEFRFSKQTDMFKALQIASVMHQRHGVADFTSALVSGLVRVFEAQKLWKRAQQERQKVAEQLAASGGAANVANAAAIAAATQTPAELEEEAALNLRKRSTLRLLTELFLCGLTADLKPLLGVLSELIGSDTRNEPDLSNTILHLLLSWLKYANRPILGLQSRSQRLQNQAADVAAGMSLPDYLTPQQREQVLNKLFIPYGKQINERLIGVHTALQKLEKRAARIQMMRGEIPLDMQDQRKQYREQLSALQSQVETYFDLLDSELAPLPVIQDAEDELFNLVSLNSADADALAREETDLGPWDDEETKLFYESLLDLTIVVPPVLLQEGQEKEKARIRREKEKASGAAAAAEEEAEEEEEKSSSSTKPKPAAPLAEDDDALWKPNWDLTIEQLESKLAHMTAHGIKPTRGGNAAASAGAASDESFYEEDEYGNALIPENFVAREKRSHPMESLLSTMAHSLNRAGVDQVAERFAYLNTKNNRMRLVEAMYTLPRTRLDEIPYWVRLLATLHAHMKHDMTDELVGLLLSEFYRLLRGKSQWRLESKIRNMRFLTELTKFQIAPPTMIFKVWHALLLSFNPNAIQLIALLLEQCGRWLYRTPLHHMRTVQFLDRTMALKESKYLDKSLTLLLENAYFAVKPPPSAAVNAPRKERTLIHQFIRKSLYQDLHAKNTDVILKRLRKLNWNEKSEPTVGAQAANSALARVEAEEKAAAAAAEAAQAATAEAAAASATPAPTSAASAVSADGAAPSAAASASEAVAALTARPAAPAAAVPPPHIPARVLVTKCLSNVSNVSFHSIPALAVVVAGLDKYHQVGVGVVDAVLESVRVGLELNRFSQNQRRLLVVRYLAELYLYKLVDSQVLFDTLYLLVTFGHEVDEAGKMVSRIDPPSDTFRIRLIVTILEVVGPHMDRGLLRQRLDRFLLHFDRYLLLKEIVPIDLQFAVSEVWDKLRPAPKDDTPEAIAAAGAVNQSTRPRNLSECMDAIRKQEERSAHSGLDRLISLTEGADEATPEASEAGEMIDDQQQEEDEQELDAEAEDGEAPTSYADKIAAAQEAADAAAGDSGSSTDSEAGDSDSDASDEWDREGDGGGRSIRDFAPRRAKEEEEFQADFDRMMADAAESAKFQPRVNNMVTVETATTAAGVTAPSASAAAMSKRPGFPPAGSSVDGEDAVAFRFLSRNKHRTQARDLWVPADADMAASTVANQASALAEKADLKRLVLAGLQRTEREQAEEDRLNQAQWAHKDRRDGVTQDFSHRERELPSDSRDHRGGGGGGGDRSVELPPPPKKGGGGAKKREDRTGGRTLDRVGANFGAESAAERANKRDLGLKLESFAFASEETLTQSRVTLHGDSRRKK